MQKCHDADKMNVKGWWPNAKVWGLKLTYADVLFYYVLYNDFIGPTGDKYIFSLHTTPH